MPDLISKFDEIGLPLEFYFSSQLLSMFADLFNCEVVFRIWDVILYEINFEQEVLFCLYLLLNLFIKL